MVLYFSGTGNSRYAAKRIAEISDDELVSINSKIKSGDHSDIRTDKPLVFVGPVYAGRFPRVMDDYIKKVNFSGNKNVYFAATCAETPWTTVKYAKKLCGEKHFTMKGFSSVVMPQGYIAGGGTKPKAENDKVLAAAEPVITEIAERIRDNKPLLDEKPGSAVMSDIINPIMYKVMITAKPFNVTDKCVGCGKCAERCPLNNINITDGRPIWGNNCTHCMACIAGCPREAIEYGKKTRGKPRYYLGDK